MLCLGASCCSRRCERFGGPGLAAAVHRSGTLIETVLDSVVAAV